MGAYSRLGTNSRLGVYSNKYGTSALPQSIDGHLNDVSFTVTNNPHHSIHVMSFKNRILK